MANEPLVKVTHLSLNYGPVSALQDISLELPAGKLIGLIGPDGVGKSSLLSLITGSHAMPETGEIQVLNGDMRSKKHRSLVCPHIAYMPQGLGKNLYFSLTVEENLQFFGRLFGHDAPERRRRIDRLTKSTGLYQFLSRPAGKLSGGMKQKLGLCCSLIHDPKLLVLDEPTTGVDPLARRQFWELVDNVRKEQPEMGVIVATAYMDEAQRFDLLVAMNQGKILAIGTPKELLEQTQCDNLDAAFIQLLPKEQRQAHHELTVPPLPPAPDGVYSIEAENLTQRFGSFTAVDHVSFKIKPGEIFGFLGSNGCGKTTTMRMLTGLLPATEGHSLLFGKPMDAKDLNVRLNLGYMTQLFSLYNELSVRQNLELYAKLYQIPDEQIDDRVQAMLKRFGLTDIQNTTPEDLPLGMKQRLSLAAAVIHHPKILILDEPTSGVDPVARDSFWEMIIELSRQDGVTIFITTHFMNEAQRCDRISLMHAGRSLACDTPQQLILNRNASTLEEAFISYLQEADTSAADAQEAAADTQSAPLHTKEAPPQTWFKKLLNKYFNPRRVYACAWRETLELLRDPIRLTLAIFGSIILMLTIGYGVNLDVENIRFAILDNDQSASSHNFYNDICGSRYFQQRPEVFNYSDMDRRMASGELSLVVEIPNQFGQNLDRKQQPELGFWIDGAHPSRAETMTEYLTALNELWLARQYRLNLYKLSPFKVETRFLYNPEVRSLPAIAPAVMPILLMIIPAILGALAIVQEKEKGSIINLYVTPLSRGEFVIGKQLPYIGFTAISFILLILLIVYVFHVPIKGSLTGLILGLFFFSAASTGMGLLASSVTKSQIAVIFMTLIGTMVPSVQFCGLSHAVNSLQGAGYYIGSLFPTSYMIQISRGVFNKSLTLFQLRQPLMFLFIAIPILVGASILCQHKQEK